MSRTVSIIVVLLCLLPMLLYFFGQPSWVKQSSFSIDDADRKELLRYSYFILDSYFNDTDTRSEQQFTLNNQQFFYDRLFITLFTNGKTRGCQSGSTDRNDPNRLFKDVRDATLKSILDDRFDGAIIQEESSNVTIMFTFLYNMRELVNHSLEFLEYYIELGIHSIEVKRGNTSAFFKESVPITNNYDVADTMKRLCVKADFPDDCYLDPSTRIFIYDTFTFYGDRDEKINELYRYDFLIRTDDIDNTLLTERLNLAVDWFKNSVNTATGLLEYEYIPSKNIYSEENNHIRKLATLWAMMKLSNFLETDELDDVIHEMLSYYQDFVTYENNFSTLSINDDANIAYNAFALLSLMDEDQPDNTTDGLMEQLAKGILTLQNDDGSYNTSFIFGGTAGIDFYPGEAMLALMTYYSKTKNQSYMDSVQHAFPFYKDYWRDNKNTAFIPWHTQTYRLLYEETNDPLIAEFIFEMNDWLIDNYQIQQSEYSDEIGGFPYFSPMFSTSVYLEGINDAYLVATFIDDAYHMEKYESAIRSGTRFILQTQFTPKSAFYCEDPLKAIGGFKESLTNNRMRIDYTQHAVLALIKIYENSIF